MSQTKTTALNYSQILKKAKTGEYQLPAFQRKWKWTNKQVMSLYDSLRLGYPIGAFLFMTSDDGERLAPRPFHGAGKLAANRGHHESLILDGQQRITAGLSIVYGLEEVNGSEYYIDLSKVDELLKVDKVNIEDSGQVTSFCQNLDIDSGYLVAKKKRDDRHYHFDKSKLIWTPYLTEDYQSEFDEILDDVSDRRTKDIIRKVIRKHLKPNTNIQVPVIELGNEFDISSISRVFSTINTSGKLLTPFELVVAVLYPHGITLEEDIAEFKSKHAYYRNIDKNGEILLQVVALLAGKSPKKSDLPKNVEASDYKMFSEEAANMLDEVGYFLSQSMGMGLDTTDKLVPYDAIFAPMALALSYVKSNIKEQTEQGIAKRKLRTWFVASALSQRYQEGVHNKQSRDLEDVKKWLAGSDNEQPIWIENAYITRNMMSASPNGAIGKLFLCLLNSRQPKDPVLAEPIGYRDNVHNTQIHHIYPTRWAPKGMTGYEKGVVETNLALNTMLLSDKTNGDWLNFSPANQISNCIKALNSEKTMADIYKAQLMSDRCIEILKKSDVTKGDYQDFLTERYKQVVIEVKEYGIRETPSSNGDSVELESPAIMD